MIKLRGYFLFIALLLLTTEYTNIYENNCDLRVGIYKNNFIFLAQINVNMLTRIVDDQLYLLNITFVLNRKILLSLSEARFNSR